MLDLGFAEDLAEVHALTKDRAQTMMFSATFAPRVQQLAMRVMRKTERIELATPESTHDNIEQRLYWADNAFHKRQLLDHFLRDTEIKQAIVFSSTQIECDSLAEDLQQDGFSAVALHGALGQAVRNRRLASVRDGTVQILVATDVAARGLDIDDMPAVINYDLPRDPEIYVHRIGRTGRAGQTGVAVTLVTASEWDRMSSIERYLKLRFERRVLDGLKATYRGPRKLKNSGKAAGPKKKKAGAGKPRAKSTTSGSRPAAKPKRGGSGASKGNDGFGVLKKRK